VPSSGCATLSFQAADSCYLLVPTLFPSSSCGQVGPSIPRLATRQTGYLAEKPLNGGGTMGVLWVLVLLLIIFALVGGVAVSNWLFVILVVALILLLVGYV
jgi:hypothetical protein